MQIRWRQQPVSQLVNFISRLWRLVFGLLRPKGRLVLGALLLSVGLLALFMPKPASQSALRDNRSLKPHVTVAIMVISAAKNERPRDAIRSTWVNFVKGQLRSKVIYRFMVGTKAKDVQEVAQLTAEGPDVALLPDVLDRYDQLTTKLLSGLEYLQERYSFDYLLKVDDDSFVNVPQLVSNLNRLSDDQRSRRLYWGYFAGDAKVKRSGKWAESGWILSDRYLPYARGGGYVLGKDLVAFLTQNRALLKVYSNEDVAVGAWLAGLDVWYQHDRRFDTEFVSRGCWNEYLVTHKRSGSQMMAMVEHLRYRGKLCEREVGLRKSYEYNWGVPPSECCKADRYDSDT